MLLDNAHNCFCVVEDVSTTELEHRSRPRGRSSSVAMGIKWFSMNHC